MKDLISRKSILLSLGAGSLIMLAFLLKPNKAPQDGMAAYYEKYKDFDGGDLSKLPKYDRPDLAAVQDFEMTRDPQTNTVPVLRSLKAFERIKRNAKSSKAIDGVNWEERGPNNVGGRTRALMFDPNDTSGKKVWAGSVSGGLWFNNDITNAASSWININDFWANLAITALAFDPSNTQTFYAGTGEGFNNADAVRGAGLWKTTNGGISWNRLATTKTIFGNVTKIAVTSTGTILVACTKGLFRSIDGGFQWFRPQSGPFADLEIASNGYIYAGAGIFSPGTIRKSTNDGASWSTITPATGGQRVEIAIAPSNPSIIYAVASNGGAVAWFKKSINGGSTWSNVTIPSQITQSCNVSPTQDFCNGIAWYAITLAVHPTNPNIVIAGGLDLHKSTNGGSSWGLISYWTGGCDTFVHADQHTIQFRPTNSNHAIFGNDGGVYYSSNVGFASDPAITARNKDYNVTQFYSADQSNIAGSNYMLGGTQDNGTQKFLSAGVNATTEAFGGDGGFSHIDQLNNNIQVLATTNNRYYRSRNGGATFSNIYNSGSGRFINPTEYDDNAKVLYGAAGVNQYTRVVDMENPSTNAFVNNVDFKGNQVSAIKASRHTNNRLFIGTGSSGGTRVFRVDGARYSQTAVVVTEIGNASLPTNAYVSSIDVGSSDDQIIVTYSNYGVTSVWETRNGGGTWINREGDLPDIPIRSVLYNPNNTDEVLVATELGVWSTDNINLSYPDWGVTNVGLANVRCDMLQYRESDGRVLVATHGRGVYTANPFPPAEVLVRMQKRNFTNFAVDGGNGGFNGAKVKLWNDQPTNINQKWVEIDRGGGFYSYQKKNTNYCIDGGNGGFNGSKVKLYLCNPTNQNQHWKKIATTNPTGYFMLEKRNAIGFSIDGSNGATQGAQLKLWQTQAGNANQHWLFSSTSARKGEHTEIALYNDNSDLKVYPNPLNKGNILSVDIPENAVNALLTVTNISGQMVHSQRVVETGTVVLKGTRKLPTGVYVLTVKTGEVVYTSKFIVK